jgi:hypothetical protein
MVRGGRAMPPTENSYMFVWDLNPLLFSKKSESQGVSFTKF